MLLIRKRAALRKDSRQKWNRRLRNMNNTEVINQLNSGYLWTGSTITYAFSTSTFGLTSMSGEASGFSAFTAAQQTKATVAIGLWDDLIARSIVKTTSTASDIDFANSTVGVDYAQAYFPSAGTVWLKTGDADLVNPTIGKHGFLTLVHELGHALGLDHMGNYNGSGTWTPSAYEDSNVLSVMSYFGPNWGTGTGSGFGQVAWADWVNASNVLYSPQTPMLNDVMAIQAMYGADLTTRTGNTVYGFNSTVGTASGGIFDFTLNLNPILCIYDAAGNDTLDLSGWSTSSTISLVPGTFCSGNSMTYNISIAYTAIIENAVGGAGADALVGNAYANILNGGGGNDTLNGGLGNDTLIGGTGSDTAIFAGALSAYSISYNATTGTFTVVSAAEGTDTVTGVESFQFSDGTRNSTSLINTPIGVSIAATTSAAFEGQSGSSAFVFTISLASAATSAQTVNFTVAGTGVNAAASDDFTSSLLGSVAFAVGELTKTITVLVKGDISFEQNETFSVTLSNPTSGLTLTNTSASATIVNDDGLNLLGTIGHDSLVGSIEADTIQGLAGNDVLDGGAGTDSLFGGDGNDNLSGGSAAAGQYNTLDGGTGQDTSNYTTITNKVYVDLRSGGGFVNGVLTDLLSSIENVVGGSNDDTLVGTDADNNVLSGGAGSDVLFGMAGNDTLLGGSANIGQYNQLWGGDGSDTASYAQTTARVYADLNVVAGWVDNGSGTLVLTDVYNSIENLAGGSGADSLVGNAAANDITGAGGADILYANTGPNFDASIDRFIFKTVADSNLSSGYDTIVNFDTSRDLVDLTAFHITASEVTIASGNGATCVYANVDGIAGYDLAFVVLGNNALDTNDFLF
jgi:serralysin